MQVSTLLCAAGLIALAACGERSPASTKPAAPVGSPAAVVASAAPPTPRAPASESAAVAGDSADRLPPAAVAPIVRDGVRYAQAPDGRDVGARQVGGVLVASDAASGKRLWTLAVYDSAVDPAQEADAQWVFFKSMAFDPDGRLRIVNEAGHAFVVDVQRHQASPAP